MCIIVTSTNPVIFAAGQATKLVLDMDQRRMALILNVIPGEVVGQDISLDVEIDTDMSTVGFEAHDNSIAPLPITGTITPATGAVAEELDTSGFRLAGTGSGHAATSGTVSGSLTPSPCLAGVLFRFPGDPGIPFNSCTEPTIMTREELFDLLNGPWFWDDQGSGAVLQGYEVIKTGETPVREKS